MRSSRKSPVTGHQSPTGFPRVQTEWLGVNSHVDDPLDTDDLAKMIFTNDSDTFKDTDGATTSNQAPMDVDTQIRIRPGTNGRPEKLCPRCGEWIGLGAKGNEYPFAVHQDGQQCHRDANLKAQTRAQTEAHRLSAASTSFGSTSIPPLSATSPISGSLSIQPIVPTSDVSIAATLPSLSPLSFLPPLVLPEQNPCIHPTVPDEMALDTLQASSPYPKIPSTSPPNVLLQGQPSPITSSTGFPAVTKVPCYGVPVKWEYGCPTRTYPFHYHSMDHPMWSVTTQRPPKPDIIFLRSFSCALFHDSSAEACFECLKLPPSDKFQSLALRASKDPAPTVPWEYLSREQLLRKLEDRTDECRRLRKRVSPTPPF